MSPLTPRTKPDIPISTWREAQLMIAEADPARSVAIINLLRSGVIF